MRRLFAKSHTCLSVTQCKECSDEKGVSLIVAIEKNTEAFNYNFKFDILLLVSPGLCLSTGSGWHFIRSTFCKLNIACLCNADRTYICLHWLVETGRQ